jgi:hypothetical protein
VGVIPRDGVRQHFSALLGGRTLHLRLNRDGFAQERQIEIAGSQEALGFVLENRGTGSHLAQLSIEGLPAGRYDLRVDGRLQPAEVRIGSRVATINIPVSNAPLTKVRLGVQPARE